MYYKSNTTMNGEVTDTVCMIPMRIACKTAVKTPTIILSRKTGVFPIPSGVLEPSEYTA